MPVFLYFSILTLIDLDLRVYVIASVSDHHVGHTLLCFYYKVRIPIYKQKAKNVDHFSYLQCVDELPLFAELFRLRASSFLSAKLRTITEPVDRDRTR